MKNPNSGNEPKINWFTGRKAEEQAEAELLRFLSEHFPQVRAMAEMDFKGQRVAAALFDQVARAGLTKDFEHIATDWGKPIAALLEMVGAVLNATCGIPDDNAADSLAARIALLTRSAVMIGYLAGHGIEPPKVE